MKKFIAIAIFLTATFIGAPAALADQNATPAPCKNNGSSASHCDQNGKNDVLGNHPQSNAHANANSDCNARVCATNPPIPPTPPTPTTPPVVASVDATVSVEVPENTSNESTQPEKIEAPKHPTIPTSVPAGDGSSQSIPNSGIIAIAIAAIAAVVSGIKLLTKTQ